MGTSCHLTGRQTNCLRRRAQVREHSIHNLVLHTYGRAWPAWDKGLVSPCRMKQGREL